jgi:hypothetical protein
MNWWITYAAAIVAWYVGGPLLSLAVWVALVAKALWDRQEAINARLSRLTREPHDNARLTRIVSSASSLFWSPLIAM